MSAAIGEKLKELVDFHRGEAQRHIEVADVLDNAWKTWDVDVLVSVGALTPSEANEIRSAKGSE